MSLFLDYEKIEADLAVIRTVLSTTRQKALAFDGMESEAMSRELEIALNIGLRAAIGRQPLSDATRHRIWGSLIGIKGLAHTYELGKSAGVEFLHFLYGPNVNLRDHPVPIAEPADVVKYLYASLCEVVVPE